MTDDLGRALRVVGRRRDLQVGERLVHVAGGGDAAVGHELPAVEVVLGKGRAVHHRAIHAVEHLVEDPFARQHGADRHVSAGQRLRQQHHVGLDAPVLDREEAPGTAEAGLDLVGDEQCPVFAAEREGAREIAVVRHVHALALDRLDQERRDLARGERPLQSLEIVERDFETVRQERLEAVAEHCVGIDRQRPVAQAVEGVRAIDEARPPGGGAREFQGRLDRFRAGAREEGLVEIGRVAATAARPECRPAPTRPSAPGWAGRCRARF